MNPERQMPVSRLDNDAARGLGGLSLIALDLRQALDSCHRLIRALEVQPQDNLLIEALWSSALVRYVRCFSGGKRTQLGEHILEGDDELIELHRFFVEMRNKHIAHSVNPFEEVAVGLVLSGAKPNWEVEGVTILWRRLQSMDVDGVRSFHALLGRLHAKVVDLVRESKAELLAWARAQSSGTFGPTGLRIATPEWGKAAEPRE